jgi:hypothetical protein
MVIESDVDDANVKMKAYLRRGKAYEQQEKLKKAKEDMIKVKELQPYNMQASQALSMAACFLLFLQF